jgi:hypothetical protein
MLNRPAEVLFMLMHRMFALQTLERTTGWVRGQVGQNSTLSAYGPHSFAIFCCIQQPLSLGPGVLFFKRFFSSLLLCSYVKGGEQALIDQLPEDLAHFFNRFGEIIS